MTFPPMVLGVNTSAVSCCGIIKEPNYLVGQKPGTSGTLSYIWLYHISCYIMDNGWLFHVIPQSHGKFIAFDPHLSSVQNPSVIPLYWLVKNGIPLLDY